MGSMVFLLDDLKGESIELMNDSKGADPPPIALYILLAPERQSHCSGISSM